MPESMPQEVGEYELLEHIATGGMADIFRARLLAGGDLVALKRLRPQHSENPAFIERFVGEAKLGVKLRHPNIVRTVKLFKKGPDYFIVQELVDGLSLAALLNLRREMGLALPQSATMQILAGLLSALDYVHRAKLGETAVTIVHRDVSPGNVLVDRQGGVKLTDFGLAEASLHPELKAERGVLAGTPAYMSPEQVVGQSLDPRSDIFSAGTLLYECLANKPPFEAEVEYDLLKLVKDAQRPPLLLEDTGVELWEALVDRAMAPLPDDRFATAAGFKRTLLTVGEKLGVAADPETLAETVAAALWEPG
jgi:serine/threonine-protein kinase